MKAGPNPSAAKHWTDFNKRQALAMSLGNNERDDYDDDFGVNVQPHRGPMILTFGILGVMTFSCAILGVFAIIAWVMGKRDLELIRRGQMDKQGESLTKTGYILGIVGTIMFLLYLLLIVAYVIFIVAMVARK